MAFWTTFALCISLLLCQTSAQSDLGSPSPTLSPTQQTPAALGGNDTCAFADLTSLVGHIVHEWAGYNLSLLVQTCPDICILVYGSGNPDISGIGAMISYILQGVSSLLFGPLLAVLSLYIGSDASSDSLLELPSKLWITESFVPVARSLHQTNIIIAFSVLVASIIRLDQIRPVAEVDFIKDLALYELWTALICTSSYFLIHESSKTRNIVIGLYAAVTWFVAEIISNSGYYPSSYGEALQAITTYCIRQDDWPVPTANLVVPDEPKTQESWLPVGIQVLIVIFSPILGVVGLAAGFIVMGILAYIGMLLAKPYLLLCRLLRLGPWRFVSVAGALALTAISGFYVGVWLDSLLAHRQELRLASGSAYQDNEWGFGQITALLAWIPVVQDTLFAIGGIIRHFSEERDAEGEESHELLAVDPDDSEDHSSTPVDSSTPQPSRAPSVVGHDTSAASSAEARREQPEPLTRGSSSDSSSGFVLEGLHPRVSWPRNDSGTYLPTRQTQ